ncbi:hypothetical protein B296_00008072 [Ensete ventricosum]|uniref:Uncharacterized protein n=1 Tax=Ensete ventricosum TaxID=4639 RepID=A0A426Y3S9_ENSVE|nr:hypothetical protein B296_00008072 [Ensete ventricosum]
MRLRTRLEYIGSLARVSGACQDSATQFFRRRPRLAERLLVVAEKLAGSCEGLTMTNYNKRIGQSQVQISSRSEDDVVGNSFGVCQELTEGIESLLGWRKRVRYKKTETHRKIIGSLDDAVGARQDFARSLPKGSVSWLGTYREITRRRP